MRASLKKTLYAGVLGLTIFGLAACSSGNDEAVVLVMVMKH